MSTDDLFGGALSAPLPGVKRTKSAKPPRPRAPRWPPPGRTHAPEDARRGDRSEAPSGEGAPLRVALRARASALDDSLGPGVGKTTIARLMATAFGLPFIAISAVLGGRQGHPRRGRRRQGPHGRDGTPHGALSSTRCTASARASRTRSCRTWRAVSSSSWGRPLRTPPSKWWGRSSPVRPSTS